MSTARSRTRLLHGLAVPLVLLGTPALALTPSEIFEKAAPSVWAVRALDAQERPFSYGTAVVVGPGQLVTRCHVLARAKAIQLRQENLLYEARLDHADVERDLCLLSAQKFNAPAVPLARLADLKVGQRVYAVGNPERVATTLSEGLLSSLRDEDGKPLLQTTAPLSPGMSGAGLFDERGYLVGIARVAPATAGKPTALHAGVPAEWVAEAPERAKALLARRNEPPAGTASKTVASLPGLPPPGATWRYGYRDRLYGGGQRMFTVRVAAIEGRDVRESFAVDSGGETSGLVDPASLRFHSRRITGSQSMVELAPYFLAAAPSGSTPLRPADYPGTSTWTIGAANVQPEDVVVPAGTFRATRVDVRGTAPVHGSMNIAASANHIATRFHYTAWYSPDVKRYVMARHQTWNSHGTQIGDEVVELLEHKRN